MNLNSITAGNKIPDDINVIIEIPANFNPIKYEIDKTTGVIFVDRFLSTSMLYPGNYGYINHTLSMDGDPLDVLVITTYPLQSMSVIRSRPIGMLKMIDESGSDIKIIAVPHYKLTKEYDHILDINDLSNSFLNKIKHFFTHYKNLEENKWVTVDDWGDKNAAKTEIITSFTRAKNFNNKK